jgi:hypothetical protein
MAHHLETMSSQIVPLSNKTTINDNETASSTMGYTNCVMMTVMAGCCLVTKTAVAMVALLLLFVSC